MSGVTLLLVVMLTFSVGVAVASTASTAMLLPLLSGVSAVHGIILVGAVIVTGRATSGPALAAGLFATVLATVNLVGGFIVADRTLEASGGHRPRGGRQ